MSHVPNPPSRRGTSQGHTHDQANSSLRSGILEQPGRRRRRTEGVSAAHIGFEASQLDLGELALQPWIGNKDADEARHLDLLDSLRKLESNSPYPNQEHHLHNRMQSRTAKGELTERSKKSKKLPTLSHLCQETMEKAKDKMLLSGRRAEASQVSRRLLLSILIMSMVPVSKFFPFTSLNFYLPFAFPFLLSYPWIPTSAWWRYGRGGEGTFSFWSYLPKRGEKDGDGDGDGVRAKSMILEGRKKKEKNGKELLEEELRLRTAAPGMSASRPEGRPLFASVLILCGRWRSPGEGWGREGRLINCRCMQRRPPARLACVIPRGRPHLRVTPFHRV